MAFTVTRVITAVYERKDAERFLDAVRAVDAELAERLRLARVDLDDERPTSNPAFAPRRDAPVRRRALVCETGDDEDEHDDNHDDE